jgi:hypothetical protein
MRKIIKKGVVLAVLGVAMAAQAATVTLNAGVPQTVQLKDAKTGATVTLSTPIGGSSHLEFSNGTNKMFGVPSGAPSGAVDFFGFLGTEYQGSAGNTFTPVFVTYGVRTKRTVVGAEYLDSGVRDLSIDVASGKILSAGLVGNFSLDVGCFDKLLSGGVITFENLRFDFTRGFLVGDMSARTSAYVCGVEPSYVWRNIDLFSFNVDSGSLVVPVAALASKDAIAIQNAGYQVSKRAAANTMEVFGKVQLSNLKITAQAQELMYSGFGIPHGVSLFDNIFSNLANSPEGWGRVMLTNRFTATAP